MATSPKVASQFMESSGALNPVWVALEPPSNRPKFWTLHKDLQCDVCIVGAGIAGISCAYELVSRGKEVVLIEAREVLSGETGRTSGHLTNALDDGYTAIAKKHGIDGAKMAAESHGWARDRVGEIAGQLGLDCEYRQLPAYKISQYPRGDPRRDGEIEELKAEADLAQRLGMAVTFSEDLAVRGWDGAIDQRGGLVFANQATFHPTKYLVGVLGWLKKQPTFHCCTHTRMMSVQEKGVEVAGIGHKRVEVQTENGHTITCAAAVEATCVPLQKLSIVAEMVYKRTYCIALRVPKGSVEDCLLYDQADEYKYVRLTRCDKTHDYLVVGGCDHKVGQEDTTKWFDELEAWTRQRFTSAGTVDYKWSGQIFEPVDYMAFIGKNQGSSHIYVVTGDSGDGLTHGTLASKIIADEIDGVDNPWSKLYSPSRLTSVAKSLKSMVSHDVQINKQYKRFLKSDIQDIEELGTRTGAVINASMTDPIAVYRDEDGAVRKFSALCPHMKGVVCWNAAEKSFDCPVHGSRFSMDGLCVMGPAKANLIPQSEEARESQEAALRETVIGPGRK